MLKLVTLEDKILSIPNCHILDSNAISKLQKYIKNLSKENEPEDPSLKSLSYYLITGRYGAGILFGKESFCFFCPNPADTKQMVIYPEVGNKKENLLEHLLERLPKLFDNIMIGKVTDIQALSLMRTINAKNLNAQIVEEELLDWRYPVRVISTREAIEHSGRRFKSLRQSLHKVDWNDVKVEPFDFNKHFADGLKVARLWVDNYHNPEDISSFEFYKHIMELTRNKSLNLHGYIFYKNDQPFALEIWEEPHGDSKETVSLAGICLTGKAMNTVPQLIKVCETLHSRGIRTVSLGGSEVIGQDIFKNKFRPVKNIPQYSIVLA